MQIRLLKRVGLGRGIVGQAGSVHVMTDDQARVLIGRGVAVEFKPHPAPVVRTTEDAAPETRAPAEKAPARGRRKRG